MRQKLFTLFILLMLLTFCGQGNKLADQFKSDITAYTEAYNDRNWEKAADMIYPKLFTIVSRDEMIKTMSLVDSAGIKMTTKLNNIEKTSEVIYFNNEKFCRVYCNSLLKVKISKSQLGNIDQLKQELETSFGKSNVQYNDMQKLFTVDAHQSMIAVSDKNSEDWKYIEYSGDQTDEIMMKLIPAEVIKQLGK